MHVIPSEASRWQYQTDGDSFVITHSSAPVGGSAMSTIKYTAQKKNEPQKWRRKIKCASIIG